MKTTDIPRAKITLDVGCKNFRNIDMKTRRKWSKLYQYRKERNKSPEQSDKFHLKINAENSMNSTFNLNTNPHSIQQLKGQKKRFVTCQRNKRNNQIFFKKRKSASRYNSDKKQSNSLSYLVRDKRILSYNSYKTLQVNKEEHDTKILPFMLQKRRKKLEKSIQIIDHLSYLSMKEIDLRQKNIFDHYHSQQRKLLEKMKGTKLYYQFVKEWKTPISKEQF